jgi:hypothetical protein
MATEKLVHLVESEDHEYGDSDTWCGLSGIYRGCTDDVSKTTCIPCLQAANEYGKLIKERLEYMESNRT